MTEAAVLVSRRDLVCEITLNRPAHRNAMSPEMLGPFQQVIDQVKADRDIRCVIITGNGSSFCSGADFRSGSYGLVGGNLMLFIILFLLGWKVFGFPIQG